MRIKTLAFLGNITNKSVNTLHCGLTMINQLLYG
jgi:hypothetical protein